MLDYNSFKSYQLPKVVTITPQSSQENLKFIILQDTYIDTYIISNIGTKRPPYQDVKQK